MCIIFELQLLVYGYGVLVDFACEVVASVSEFGDLKHNSAMEPEHYYDFVVEKL